MIEDKLELNSAPMICKFWNKVHKKTLPQDSNDIHKRFRTLTHLNKEL